MGAVHPAVPGVGSLCFPVAPGRGLVVSPRPVQPCNAGHGAGGGGPGCSGAPGRCGCSPALCTDGLGGRWGHRAPGRGRVTGQPWPAQPGPGACSGTASSPARGSRGPVARGWAAPAPRRSQEVVGDCPPAGSPGWRQHPAPPVAGSTLGQAAAPVPPNRLGRLVLAVAWVLRELRHHLSIPGAIGPQPCAAVHHARCGPPASSLGPQQTPLHPEVPPRLIHLGTEAGTQRWVLGPGFTTNPAYGAGWEWPELGTPAPSTLVPPGAGAGCWLCCGAFGFGDTRGAGLDLLLLLCKQDFGG